MTYLPKKLKVKKVKKYTEDTWSFVVESPMNPKPGQFIEVSIPGIGEAPLTSSISSDKELDILTKKVGRVTKELFKLKKGDDVWIRGPYGNSFPLEEMKGKNVIAVGAGTGTSPIASLIDHVSKNKKDYGQLFAYFGYRDESHILLKDKMKKWAKEFHCYIGLSREKKDHKFERGHVQDIMEHHKPPIKNTIAVLCGPESLMFEVTEELVKLGLSEKDIYWAMERRMECCIGSCGRCQLQELYVCRDGPVFRCDIIKPKVENEMYSNEVGKNGE